jgi:hypothetical protein
MKFLNRAVLALALAALFALPARAANDSNQYAATVSATTANSTVTFTHAVVAIEVLNDGPSTIYFQPDAVAVASSTTAIPIAACEGRLFQYNGTAVPTSVGIITASSTATVRVTGFYAQSHPGDAQIGPGEMSKVITGVCSTATATNYTVSGTLTNSALTASRLVVSDASKGLASNGAITTNAVPKSASSGASLAASSVSDDGTTVTIASENAAITTANGAAMTWTVQSESITLSTSGATTDSSANLLPANSIIDSVVCRVTTTITTATDWKISDPTTAGRFSAADSTMTANETIVGLAQWFGNVTTTAAGPSQASAAKLRITTTGTPGAGVVRCTTYSRVFTAPTS